MKKKIIIICIAVILLILVVPTRKMFWDGGTIEYKALLYKITKYHKLDENSKDGYNDGIKIEILGFTIYNNFVENSEQIVIDEKLEEFYNDSLTNGYINITELDKDYSLEEAIKDNAVVVSNNTIANPDLLDNFIVNINTGKSAFLRLVETTIEGDLIITDIKYDGNKVLIITDNTRDEFYEDSSKKISIDEYMHIEEIFNFDKDSVVSSLIVYNNNKDESRVLLKRNRIIN